MGVFIVQRRRGLVRNNKRWFVQYRAGDGGALFFTMTELVRSFLLQPIQAYGRKNLSEFVSVYWKPGHRRRKGDILLQRQGGNQMKILKNEPYLAAAKTVAVASIKGEDILIFKPHASLRRREQSRNHGKERRFSATGRTSQQQAGAAIQGKIRIKECRRIRP